MNKDKIYFLIVERNVIIKKNYQNYVNNNLEEHSKFPIKSWLYLILLNLKYRVFRCKDITANKSKKNTSSLTQNKLIYPEYLVEKRISVDDMVEKFNGYDYISFDVFDTLIFRAFDEPTDLFALLGNRLGIMNYKSIRIAAEKEARATTKKPYNEINIYDIYDIIADRCGIDKDAGIQAEIQLELEYCFANPYMMEIFNEIKKRGKRVIAVSNMYLPESIICKMLEKCGYSKFERVFVSCDHLCSKRNGKLIKKISAIIGKENKVIHIGDNFVSDFEGARCGGWSSVYYKNVNSVGRKYRPANMSVIGGSIYKGLVNAKLHNGIGVTNPYYEFGYVYGGIIACGYCEWLNKLAKEKDIDKFLFSSRDMYIIHEIYNKYYNKVDNDYVLISRFAAQRFAFNRFSEHFINANILSRALLKNMTIRDVLKEVGLDFLLVRFEEEQIDIDKELDTQIFVEVKKIIYKYKSSVLDYYKKNKEAAIEYYEQFIHGHKNICIVDLGWKGTNLLCLKYLLEEESTKNVNVTGALMATQTDQFINFLTSKGTINAYMFSDQLNTILTKQHMNNDEIRRLVCEILFTSNDLSLKEFDYDLNGKVIPVYMQAEERSLKIVNSINQGIRDFADDYFKYSTARGEISLSGFEVYLPLNKLVYNKDYLNDLFHDFEINLFSGLKKGKYGMKFNDAIRRENQ